MSNLCIQGSQNQNNRRVVHCRLDEPGLIRFRLPKIEHTTQRGWRKKQFNAKTWALSMFQVYNLAGQQVTTAKYFTEVVLH